MEIKSRSESTSLQKIHSLPPVKEAEYRWISPKHSRVSVSRGSASAGAVTHIHLTHHSARPSEALIRSSEGASVKSGVVISTQITQALRSRGIQRRLLSLSSPLPQVFLFVISLHL